jgi:hypothetical protein
VDSSVVIALIALAGGIIGGCISIYGQSRLAKLTARREADGVLARYREPLVGAAYELQGRLYNIIKLGFLGKYYVNGDEAQKRYAVENTLYVVAQYFGWSEILRREIQFLSFGDTERTRLVAERQRRLVELFQSDDDELGRPFLVWRGEQRAIGELMVSRDGDDVQCLGYASFVKRQDPEFRSWLERLETEIDELATGHHNPRLAALQHALVDLVRELDPKRLRYPDEALEKV